jgi:Fic family protein
MPACLASWESFLHMRGELPDLVQCALMHEQFEAIHPFLDGNGRVGRLLITLFLIERGRLSQPLLYLSAYIERNRDEYYELLQAVRTRGSWSEWIIYFLRGVADISKEAIERSRRLLTLRERLRTKLASHGAAVRLLDELFKNPFITVARASKLLSVTNPTARQAVKRLEDAGILEETTGREWRKLYLARPILKIVNAMGATRG